MTPLDDIALLALLDDLESDLVERKEAWQGNAPETGPQAICAFANDLPNHQRPGVLFVGVRDNGQPSNIVVTDQLLQTLADLRSSGNILPPPVITVRKANLKGADVAVVTTWPSDSPPVKCRGRIWIRVGPRRAVATAQEERILNEKRRFKDLPFDAQPVPSCPFGELNRTEFEGEFLPKAFAADVLEANERTYEQRLAACGMIRSAHDPVPTVVGILTVGKSARTWLPCSYVQFLRIGGLQLGDPIIDEEVIDGSLATTLRRLDEKLKAHLTTSIDISSRPIETRSTPYPLAALQQLTRNAVMHRTYENTNSPIRVSWFADRIEIWSPGGPFGIVTAENFGRPGYTDYRNPNVASAMRTLGYVQRFGVGIATAQKLLAENGNPPATFVVEMNAVLATVRA